MTLSLFNRSRRTRPFASGHGRRPAYFRPSVDVLEDRAVPAALGTINLPIDVSNLHVVQQVNQATGATEQVLQGAVSLAGQQAGTLIAALTTAAAPAAGECPILNLHIDPIHLNLLGLHVDTSAICLDVTATDHQGLLGGLLCDLSGGGLNLGGILGELGGVLGQVNTFLGDVEGLLDNVLGGSFAVDGVFAGAAGAATHQAGHTCDILNLSLGPVNLDVPLLGVSVDLDNCANGPVTVDVTGQQGGGLLGDLLCGLADGLNGVNPGSLIGRVDHLIDRLGDLAGALNRLDQLPASRRAEHLVDQVTKQLEKAADKVDSLADLGRFIDRLDGVIARVDRLLDRAA